MSSFYRRLPAIIALKFLPFDLDKKALNWRKRSVPVPNFSPDEPEINAYLDSLKNVKYWHGTGKYKYNYAGKVEDIFAGILKNGLIPYKDSYLSILSDDLIMESISVVKQREIARCYSDIHCLPQNLSYRCGSTSFWLTQHYSRMYFTIYTKYFFLAATRLLKWRKNVNLNKNNSWSQKVNKKARNTWKSFDSLSDIDGNFPIILGFSDIKHQVKLPDLFTDVEVRTNKNIPLESISHIEAPKSQVPMIKSLLKRMKLDHIKVFSIELGEFYLYHTKIKQ